MENQTDPSAATHNIQFGEPPIIQITGGLAPSKTTLFAVEADAASAPWRWVILTAVAPIARSAALVASRVLRRPVAWGRWEFESPSWHVESGSGRTFRYGTTAS